MGNLKQFDYQKDDIMIKNRIMISKLDEKWELFVKRNLTRFNAMGKWRFVFVFFPLYFVVCIGTIIITGHLILLYFSKPDSFYFLTSHFEFILLFYLIMLIACIPTGFLTWKQIDKIYINE